MTKFAYLKLSPHNQVSKAIRKKEKGVVIFAGDVSPIDVYSAMPVACEDAGLPYIYVPARIGQF